MKIIKEKNSFNNSLANNFFNPYILPETQESEKALLHALILRKGLPDLEGIEKTYSILYPEDFSNPNLGKIFEILRSMFFSGVEINYITVIDELKKRGLIESSRDFFAIFDEGEIFSQSWKSYLKIIKQNAFVRKFNLDVSQGVDLREASKRLQEGLKELERLEDREFTPKSLKELLEKDFPEPKFVVEDILPEGFSIIVGLPKIGKSWLALNIGLAVASGGIALGNKRCQKMGVLYLALEDNERRLQSRVKAIGEIDKNIPEWFYYETSWDKGEAGLSRLERYLEENIHIGLVIIDTLACLLEQKRKNLNPYLADYSQIEPLRRLCNERKISILAIHHRRKSESDEDWTLDFSGTTGLTAVADTLLALKRKRGEDKAILYADGRDLKEKVELALEWDNTLCSFRILGSKEEVIESEYKNEILSFLKNNDKGKPKEIAEATGIKVSMVYRYLNILVEEGLVRKEARGEYSIKKEPTK